LDLDEIKVALVADFFPFAFAQNDSLVGIEIALLSTIEGRLGIPLNITQYSFQNLLESLYYGEYDIAIGAISITEGRRELFDFSVPYFNATQTFLSRMDSAVVIDSLDAISRLRVGVINHSTSQLFIENTMLRQGRIPAGNLRRFSSLSSLTEAILAAEVDIIILEKTVAELVAERYPLMIVYEHYIEELISMVFKQDSRVAQDIDRILIRYLNSEEWKNIKRNYLL
jgi:polar amino acid transport system substrate-binding protein